MSYLVLFFLLSVGVSFLCSILEAVLLSTQMSYISVLEKKQPRTARRLRGHKENISQSIGSILILNTIANTLGATAVGAQAAKVFDGDFAMVMVSVVLTFSILFFSEIIPKTIGAIYWKALAPLAGRIIQFFILITYPILIITTLVTNKISRGGSLETTTKDELLESMLISEDEGVIDEKESDYIENVLKVDEKEIHEILTPRSVVFALNATMSIKEVLDREPDIFNFSRIPIFNDTIDDITGIVLTKKLFKQSLVDDSVPLASIQDNMHTIHESLSVMMAIDMFIKKKQHMFLVIDSHAQTEGILTLEDCVETLLGIEIMDESDTIEDMRELVKINMKIKRRKEKEA
ncbi:MAG TPA: DUF21 domain-containing protein [Campylobacterales bacterium]|nr:DUF21 domain-containing protein [Campylobacterales bacterium]